MSESKEHVRELSRELGIAIPEERLEQLAQAWDEAVAEAAAVRRRPTPHPIPTAFEAGWGETK